MYNQVPVIGILMIVNGVLCTLFGMLLMFWGPFMQQFLNMQGAPPPPPEAQQVLQVVSIVYIALGAVVALAGVINIAGGVAALRYRSRAFVLTALFFNIIPIFTCYCAPTSLGLMIWGLIVMFQGDVAQAFSLGASGYSAEEIRQRMAAGARHDDYRDDYHDAGRGDERRLPPSDRAEPDDRLKSDRPPPKGDPGEDRIQEK